EATIVATGSTAELLSAGRAILDARLFPVAVELVSSSFGTRIGISSDDTSDLLFVRFAGNDKAIAYQIEQTLIHLKNSAIKTSEVLPDDSQLWDKVAAMPIKAPSFETRVLPTSLAEKLHSIDGPWQVGIADGRIRVMSQPAVNTSRDALNQRVK